MTFVLLALLTAAPPNVLGWAAPSHGHHPKLTDGVTAYEGDDWLAPAAVELGAPAEFDLGEVRTFAGGAIQADHNDRYVVSVSDDQATWRDVLFAEPLSERGLRTRTFHLGSGAMSGRYVRLRGEGGDGRYSVSEVELFTEPANSALLQTKWLPDHPADRQWLGLVVVAVVGLAVCRWRPAVARFVVPGLGLAAAVVAWQTLKVDPTQERITWVRLMVASLATAAVLLEPRARSAWFVGVLAFCGAMAVVCFLNFGRPQFFDQGRGAPTFLHHYDMRTYWPIAKYFHELRFDGVYAASVAVVADERGGLSAMGSTPLRNLRDHEVRTVAESREYIDEVRQRFSDTRWAEFENDMQYFRRAMGDGGFLGSMNDHGGNATPVWFLAARLLFAPWPASDAALWLGVAVDALLVLLAFAALLWAYGPRTAFLAMTVFGAMDFYMFGTNWFGAALRHDWLALWCLGVALLKKERFAAAGALLAWASLIRAFPALTFVTLAMPLVWPLLNRGPDQKVRWGVIRSLALGAGGFGALLFAASSWVFGVDAWAEWLRKVSLLNAGGHLNNIALKTYVVGEPVAALVVTGVVLALTFFALREAPLDEAAAFGTALVGVVFNPANYYLHCLFILVVLGRESVRRAERPRGDNVPWLVLTLMCVGCYFTNLTTSLDTHFARETWVMVAALVALLGWQVRRSLEPALE